MDDETNNELRVAKMLIESQKMVIKLLYEMLEKYQQETVTGNLNIKVVKLPVKVGNKKAGDRPA